MRSFGQLSTKGQIVIPAELRERYGLGPGSRVAIEAGDDYILLRPVTDKLIESLRGCLKGKPLSGIREREHKDDRDL